MSVQPSGLVASVVERVASPGPLPVELGLGLLLSAHYGLVASRGQHGSCFTHMPKVGSRHSQVFAGLQELVRGSLSSRGSRFWQGLIPSGSIHLRI
jgi:hypothetical protein